MKRLFLLLPAMFTFGNVFGQDFDEILVRRHVDCRDIAEQSSIYYVRYMEEEHADSLASLLDYWESKCGTREPIVRARIVQALADGRFREELFPEEMMDYVVNYRIRIGMINTGDFEIYETYTERYGYVPPGGDFDHYIILLASKLTERYPEGSVEHLVAKFYSGQTDYFLDQVQKDEYRGTVISGIYHDTVAPFVELGEMHYSLIIGAWIPTGELSALGVHPELGFQMGWKRRRSNVDMVLTAKFLNTPDPYMVSRDGLRWEPTQHFFGAHFGVEYGYDIFSRGRHEVQAVLGVAYDGFDAIDKDEDRGIESLSVGALNLNAGAAYRFYINKGLYIGLRAKYNYADYTSGDSFALKGNPVTIQFSVGFLENVFRNTILNRLRYRERQ